MKVPAFSENRNRFYLCFQKCLDILVILWPGLRPTGASECNEPYGLKGYFFGQGKKSCIFWIGPRPPPFDVMNAEFIQLLSNAEFIFCRKVDLLPLGSIP